jgi:ribulose-phosphate 3-epimerase
MKKPIIAPSLLSADFTNLEAAARMLNQSEAAWFHLDVMDGVFVPNLTFGMPIVKQLRKHSTKVFDCHLMIVQPERYVEAFADAGADYLTVHYEASTHLHRTIQHIKSCGMKAGVALNPHTPVEVLTDVLADLDLVLIMSVNPGFGGQQFITQALNKVARLVQLRAACGSQALIEIDGGVNLQTGQQLVAAGADVLVAGNYVFSAPNPQQAIVDLMNV